MIIELPLSRPLSLGDARIAALKHPVVLTREGVAAFVTRFTAMGLAHRVWDHWVATLCSRSSAQAMLAAIAFHRIATIPGGHAFLCNDTRLRGVLDMSAELLLSELNPTARQALLAAPPELRHGGLPVIKLAEAHGARVDLVLTQDCVGHATHVRSWQLTHREIARSGWRQKNDAHEYIFLRALLDLTHTAPLDCANHGTLRRLVDMVAGEPSDPVNMGLCQQLATHLVHAAARDIVAQAAPSARGVNA